MLGTLVPPLCGGSLQKMPFRQPFDRLRADGVSELQAKNACETDPVRNGVPHYRFFYCVRLCCRIPCL
jgi:hypothetical protein